MDGFPRKRKEEKKWLRLAKVSEGEGSLNNYFVNVNNTSKNPKNIA